MLRPNLDAQAAGLGPGNPANSQIRDTADNTSAESNKENSDQQVWIELNDCKTDLKDQRFSDLHSGGLESSPWQSWLTASQRGGGGIRKYTEALAILPD